MHKRDDAIREVTDLPPDQIFVAATDTPSSRLMEAGMVLPSPPTRPRPPSVKALQKKFPGTYDDYE